MLSIFQFYTNKTVEGYGLAFILTQAMCIMIYMTNITFIINWEVWFPLK